VLGPTVCGIGMCYMVLGPSMCYDVVCGIGMCYLVGVNPQCNGAGVVLPTYM